VKKSCLFCSVWGRYLLSLSICIPWL